MPELPWDQWDTAVEAALRLYPHEKTAYGLESRAWLHVLTTWGARVTAPYDSTPMQVLRADRPPLVAAAAWWTVLVADTAPWDSTVRTLIRECRNEYIEVLRRTQSVDAALHRTESRWDRLCDAFYPGTYPATPAETLRRVERRLTEVIDLRLHAAKLLRDATESDVPTRAQQLYALDELEFERALKWVQQLRLAMEEGAPLPEGAAYSYVDPILTPEPPSPPADPFAFDTPSTTPGVRAEPRPQPAVSRPSTDPFDFDTALSGKTS